MKQSEYEPAGVVEIARADDIILGWKDFPGLDCTANPPEDRQWVEQGGFEMKKNEYNEAKLSRSARLNQ